MLHQIRATVRQRSHTTLSVLALVAATSLGAVALSVPAANAAPVTSRARVVHDDPLAPIAAGALADLQTFLLTGDHGVRDRYVIERDFTATEIANRVGVDPEHMKHAWAAANSAHQTALLAALSQLGVSYHRNMSRAGEGFDCSGLTAYAWEVAGTFMAHQSRTQINTSAPRTSDTAQAGDLVYYPGHAMLYLGVDRTIVHAPNSGRTIEVGQVPNRRGVRFADPTG